MTDEEYQNWKEQNPDEWNNVFEKVFSEFTRWRTDNNFKDDHIMMHVVSNNLSQQEFTCSRVEKALVNKNDCCDDLVRKHKQHLDYLEKVK